MSEEDDPVGLPEEFSIVRLGDNDPRRMSTDRFYGGVDGRIANLKELLSFIHREPRSRSAISDWIERNTNGKEGDFIDRNLGFLQAANLLREENDRFELAPYGERYLAAEESQVLLQAFRSGFKGFDTVLAALTVEPRTDDEINELVAEKFEAASSGTAIRRHREWLEAMGYVTRTDGMSSLTTAGEAIISELGLLSGRQTIPPATGDAIRDWVAVFQQQFDKGSAPFEVAYDEPFQLQGSGTDGRSIRIHTSVAETDDATDERTITVDVEHECAAIERDGPGGILTVVVESARVDQFDPLLDTFLYLPGSLLHRLEADETIELPVADDGTYGGTVPGRVNNWHDLIRLVSTNDGPPATATGGPDDPDLYQIVLTSDRDKPIWQNYHQTIERDVSGTAIADYLPEPVPDTTRVWGTANATDLAAGDVVLVGDGDDEYRQIARVQQVTSLDPEQAVEFANLVGWQIDGDGSRFTDIMVFETIWDVKLSTSTIWDVVGYNGFPFSAPFQSIDIHRDGSTFIEEYGSVEAFLEQAGGDIIYSAADIAKPETHPLLQHVDSKTSVWAFGTGPSDILTNIRRSAIQWSSSKQDVWQAIDVGDIVLLRCVHPESKKIEAVDNIGQKGIVGIGVVTGHSQKTDRWWWNERDSLVYPYILEFETLWVPHTLDEMDLSVPTFQRKIPTLQQEITALAAAGVPYPRYDELIEAYTQDGGAGRMEEQRFKFSSTGPKPFLSAVLDEFDQLKPLYADGREVSDDSTRFEGYRREILPGMIPHEDPVDEDEAELLERRLVEKGQIILYGPPGTGKTYTARKLARSWLTADDQRVPTTHFETVTFHPSFAYEDFMEGLTATANDDGQVEYFVEDGIFKRLCERAAEAYRETVGTDEEPPAFILLIDELNRGNLSKIFGEIISQLELDKRLDGEAELSTQWAHSGESVSIPPNVYLIGTMNTADQSITLVDSAIRRRFSFHSFPPDLAVVFDEYDLTPGATPAKDSFNELLLQSIHTVRVINERIRETDTISRGKQIGHSYLLNHQSRTDILHAWVFEILPLLEDYYFGDVAGLMETIFDIDPPADQRFPLIDMERLEVKQDAGVDELMSGLKQIAGSYANGD